MDVDALVAQHRAQWERLSQLESHPMPFPEEKIRAHLSGQRGAAVPPQGFALQAKPQWSHPTESDALVIVGQCPHARLCNCASRGFVDCQPGGRHPGQRLPPAVCQRCLEEFPPIPEPINAMRRLRV